MHPGARSSLKRRVRSNYVQTSEVMTRNEEGWRRRECFPYLGPMAVPGRQRDERRLEVASRVAS